MSADTKAGSRIQRDRPEAAARKTSNQLSDQSTGLVTDLSPLASAITASTEPVVIGW